MGTRRRTPETGAAPSASTEGQRECARGDWCTGYRLVDAGDGTSKRAPGLTYQAFCVEDTAAIRACLDGDADLPAAYTRLAADLTDPARRGQVVRVPFGPRMLLSEYYDQLMRRIIEVVCSYEERVRTAASLSPVDTQAVAARAAYNGGAVVAAACRLLAAHLSALLGLPPGPVYRHIPSAELRAVTSTRYTSPVLALWQDAIVRANRDGTAEIRATLSGAAAGLEILDLQRRCLAALGEVATQPEMLDGVPCRSCGAFGLQRAEPPANPATEPDYSRCPQPSCGDRMNLTTYRHWVNRYEAWVRDAGPLTCVRCQNGMCDQCVYLGCECAGQGHPQAA